MTKTPQKYLTLCSPRASQRKMRTQINKLIKKHSTKAERRFLEMLKRNHIPFKTKIKIAGHEVDFLIGNYTIDLDGHPQNVQRNWDIIQAGYSPIHYPNSAIPSLLIEEWLKKIWQIQSGHP